MPVKPGNNGRILILLASLILSACAVPGKNTELFTYVPVPETWQAVGDSSTPEPWLSDFHDENLNALVNEALRGNFDLQLAASRIESFQAQRKAANADRWPTLSATTEASRSQQEIAGIKNRSNEYALQLALNWELDIWLRLSHQVRAAVLDVEAAQADLEAARLSLVANVARGWYDAVTASQQVALAKATEKSFADSLAVIEARYRNGIGDALDVTLARANLASARSQVQARQVQADNAVLLLETLLGRYPARALVVTEKMPHLEQTPGAGVPAQLTARRPDVRSAQLAMLADTERLTAANRNYLPRLNLTGQYGPRGSELDDVLDFDGLVWRIASQLTAPLFQAGRLEAERELAAATQAQSVLNFASVALGAFREVESALRADKYLMEQQRALEIAVEESTRAETLAMERYSAGLVDITTLLDTQRRAVDAKRSLIDLRNQRIQNRINLHVALGGDFSEGASVDNKVNEQAS